MALEKKRLRELELDQQRQGAADSMRVDDDLVILDE
jgi:hypothetical protein